MKKAIRELAKAVVFLTAIIACATFIDNIDRMLIACMAVTLICIVIFWKNL